MSKKLGGGDRKDDKMWYLLFVATELSMLVFFISPKINNYIIDLSQRVKFCQ